MKWLLVGEKLFTQFWEHQCFWYAAYSMKEDPSGTPYWERDSIRLDENTRVALEALPWNDGPVPTAASVKESGE